MNKMEAFEMWTLVDSSKSCFHNCEILRRAQQENVEKIHDWTLPPYPKLAKDPMRLAKIVSNLHSIDMAPREEDMFIANLYSENISSFISYISLYFLEIFRKY